MRNDENSQNNTDPKVYFIVEKKEQKAEIHNKDYFKGKRTFLDSLSDVLISVFFIGIIVAVVCIL